MLIYLINIPSSASAAAMLSHLPANAYLNGDKRRVFCTPCGGWPSGRDCNKLTRMLAIYQVLKKQ